jgi:multidrug efflux pump subunit AcrB
MPNRNLARFFVYNKPLAWLLLVLCAVWGFFGYNMMPTRKDPEIPVRQAVAVTAWPGISAEKIEQLVTKPIEEKASENTHLEKITSVTRKNVSVVYFYIQEGERDTGKQFDDIKLKLDGIKNLPPGAGPIQFIKDFGDTAALMLTVASPKADAVEIGLRAKEVAAAITAARKGRPGKRCAVVMGLPLDASAKIPDEARSAVLNAASRAGLARSIVPLDGPGFVGFDAEFSLPPEQLRPQLLALMNEKLPVASFHPDVWEPAFIEDVSSTEKELSAVAGDKYSYRKLDDYTDLLRKNLLLVPQVARVTRSGLLGEKVYLEYSQQRLAGYGIGLPQISSVLGARNITLTGGVMDAQGRQVGLAPQGQFSSEKDIGDVLVATSKTGSPVYLRDIFDVRRDYENPPAYLNYYLERTPSGAWKRTRAVTLAIQMKDGGQIYDFGKGVDEKLAEVKSILPPDLILEKTSDQPLQVKEKIDLFMHSLYEAIFLVVLVALVGFWEWRISLLMATSIPTALAITFGLMHMLGLDLQQISISSLVLALGLLVDVPVVASDAIQRELEKGMPLKDASWLGPTHLSKAILFATLTNIVAYLPYLLITGATGEFLFTMPVVISCSLLASYFVSMSFIPLIASYILKPEKAGAPAHPENGGFYGFYYRAGKYAIDHRWKVFLFSLPLMFAGIIIIPFMNTQFFPKDLSYLSYVDIWMPEDASVAATNTATKKAEQVIEQLCETNGGSDSLLKSLTTFVGGGGPRFWFSVSPEMVQSNYAQIIIQVKDNRTTNKIVDKLQSALSAQIPGARIDVRQLETGKPVGTPVAVRISGPDMDELMKLADNMRAVFRAIPQAERVRDDWGSPSLQMDMDIDPARANLSGISNLDVAASAAGGINGYPLTTLYDADKQIPIVARLRMDERANLSDLSNLYVFSQRSGASVPLGQAASLKPHLGIEKIAHRNQFRTVTVQCFPAAGVLASQVLDAARPAIKKMRATLPPGYMLEIGGEYEEQVKGFRQLAVVMLVSVICIYLALVVQFNNLVKPLIVFAAVPYGMTGAILMLLLMNKPFGFMAFLGVVSLIGVIISHIIVLFDFIEIMQEKGEPFVTAVLDAGVVRLRPVMITVGAAIFGLIPLAIHGGPLWEPLCYAQIGGLAVATFITLLLVPVLYAIAVLDLKIIKWEMTCPPEQAENKEEEGLVA